MSIAGHLNDDVLERYAMRSLSEAEAETVEDHIALCSHCVDRLDEFTAYTEGMHSALRNRPAEAQWKLKVPSWIQRGWGAPIWAGCAMAAAGFIFLTLRPVPLPPPSNAVLDGTRGASTIVHGTGPFDFELFMPAEGPRYHVELLDADGRKQWEGDVSGQRGKLHAVVNRRVSPGQYYLHVAEPQSGSQHDYAVQVER